MALLEVCCGNPESVDAAVAGGARRIELCSALELDGLTPPVEWIREARRRYPSLTIHVLVRPRAGDFVYTEEEIAATAAQIETALEAGADGIVIGCLTPEGDVDFPAMQRLMQVVEEWNLAQELLRSDLCHAANDAHFFPDRFRPVSVTFHRAFDVCKRPIDALEGIIGLGCDRILTSGQAPTALDGADRLLALRKRADGRIILLPGGGVTPQNAGRILALTGCTEIHASASETLGGIKKTMAAKVAAIVQAIQ